MSRDKQPVSDEKIREVHFRLLDNYHLAKALHGLCMEWIGRASSGDDVEPFVILRESLRAIARDMENCAEVLDDDVGGFGYFESEFGSI
jgi:uncharacterized protein (DUF849 family)